MKLEKLTIKNFKSLADVTITPSDLTVIIGPNGSGKTNLANAFGFLKEVYANGLETAIQRSGGFDNIILAKKKKGKSDIEFETVFTTTKNIFSGQIRAFLHRDTIKQKIRFSSVNLDDGIPVTISHYFSIRSIGQILNGNYKIAKERYTVKSLNEEIISISREESGKIKTWYDESKISLNELFTSLEDYISFSENRAQELLTHNFPLRMIFDDMRELIANWAVYQLFPNSTKTAGVPTPNPTLSLYGENLPVLVDYIKKKEPSTWLDILSTMERVVPTLIDITTGYLYNKTIGLFFHEQGIGRPWNAEEVSDGTVLTLAMLCSVNDSRNTLVFIEEPENSLHPWILRELLKNFKNAINERSIIITTHSPTLIDMVSPDTIWCISKSNQQTQLSRLTDIATELQADWEEGRYKTSDYLDSGLVPQAIPGGSI